MKRTLMLLAAGLVALVGLAGCSGALPTPQIKPVILTPAQFFAAACTPVKQAMALAPMFAGTLPADVGQKVQDAGPMVKAACTAGATVSITNVQQFADTVLPAANAVIQAAPPTLIANEDKIRIDGGIALSQLAVDTVSAIATNAAATAAPASSPAAASPASGVATQ